MAGYTPLRRWRQFFPAFDAIHGAIEATDPAVLAKDELGCARVLQGFTAEVAQLLRDSAWNDPAERFCVILDDLMVEYLVTLRTVPVAPSVLASTGVAKAVGALYEHQSEKIRGLAREIVGGWREAVEKELGRAMEGLLIGQDLKPVVPVAGEKKTASVVRNNRGTVPEAWRWLVAKGPIPYCYTHLALPSEAKAMAAHSPLRRWKRFFAAFDAAIVASGGEDAHECVVVLRKGKVDIVQNLCGDAVEDLCRILDDVMFEYLVALTRRRRCP
ncbi:hypothetical protein EJB05_04573, partial [Eragrostis curvula]